MRKEEEATRLALRFSGLEHLVSVPFGTERVFDLVFVDRVHFTNLLELFGGILVNGYLLIDSKHSLISGPILHIISGRLRLFWSLLDIVSLDELVLHKVLIPCFIPLLGILNLDSVQSADSHQLVALFFLKFSVCLSVILLAKIIV